MKRLQKKKLTPYQRSKNCACTTYDAATDSNQVYDPHCCPDYDCNSGDTSGDFFDYYEDDGMLNTQQGEE